MAEPTASQSAQVFLSVHDYPELNDLGSHWQTVRDEGLRLLPVMVWVEDFRTVNRRWKFGPLFLEEGDRTPERDQLAASMRRSAHNTMKLVGQIPGLLGCGFSYLVAGGHIAEHVHSGPFVTGILGLTPAHPCRITVGGTTQFIQEGEFTIFDYAQPHEVVNESSIDRLALLVLLPNKNKRHQVEQGDGP